MNNKELKHLSFKLSHHVSLTVSTVLAVSLFPIFHSENCWKHCLPQWVCLCYRPCLYIKLSATAAHWDCCVYSICMHGVWVCVSGRKCVWERQTEKMRERERERWWVVCVWSVHLHLCVSECVYMCMFGPGAGTCVCPWAGNAGVPGLSSASC